MYVCMRSGLSLPLWHERRGSHLLLPTIKKKIRKEKRRKRKVFVHPKSGERGLCVYVYTVLRAYTAYTAYIIYNTTSFVTYRPTIYRIPLIDNLTFIWYAVGNNREVLVMSIGQESKMERTAVVEARVDVRDLANFARFLVTSGDRIATRSDLIWRAFRSITESLKVAGVPCFQSTEEAHSYMISLGIGTMNRLGRGGRAMNSFTLSKVVERESLSGVAEKTIEDMSVDDLIKVAQGIGIRPKTTDTDEPIATDDNALQRAAIATERDAEDRQRMADFVSSMKNVKPTEEG
jgi:hypothetical protein